MEKGARGQEGPFLQWELQERWFPNMGIISGETHLCSVMSLPLGALGLLPLPHTTCSTPHPLSQPLEGRSLAPGLPLPFLPSPHCPPLSHFGPQAQTRSETTEIGLHTLQLASPFSVW